ncbi:hypothetical protein [Azospirillum sp.]|uniref:hypothetical protein n=1 Tax=Azospirillum sp. TaxID=34012 RepID=UPI003D71520A
MRTVWTGLAAAAALTLGSAALAAQDGKSADGGSGKGSDLGTPPAIQGESWFGTGDQDNNRMGERRTDKQKNAIETKDQGPIGRVPDAAKGETGLKGESTGSGSSAGSGDGSAK